MRLLWVATENKKTELKIVIITNTVKSEDKIQLGHGQTKKSRNSY